MRSFYEFGNDEFDKDGEVYDVEEELLNFSPLLVGRGENACTSVHRAVAAMATPEFTVRFTLFQDHPILCINIWRCLWEMTQKTFTTSPLSTVDLAKPRNKKRNLLRVCLLLF
ncbi:hypothetical protein DVH24_028664 [Malus domestica]|uniref:Uncharacterized protein n=1 Tax=Malus domestica TaxID=3750 RepID=A0A498IYF0_MALDO|nr:hypothetical protein DVH24_028664 [Malus domestica]